MLERLNDAQMEAVKTTEGYVRVIAGAGSGKTKALTNRYVYLVENGVLPENIFCITFTNKAANEMKTRIRRLAGDIDTGYICTIHGLCVRILREVIRILGYPKTFLIMDENDQESVLRKVYKDNGYNAREYPFSMATDMICRQKIAEVTDGKECYIDMLNTPDLNECYSGETHMKRKIYYGYLVEQRKCFGLDFDDLILFTYYILQHFPSILGKWQEKARYVMVDEFQDVSYLQYELACMLSKKHGNLFVVGDPDQTIYSWRGADVNIILDFDKKFQAKTIMMTQNYRSQPNILDASNSLIEKNFGRIPKDLVAQKTGQDKVEFHHAPTPEDESRWVVDKIEELHREYAYDDIAILYRAHYVSRQIEERLIEHKIPYTIYSGISFYSRKEIKDMISYMRLAVNEDDMSFRRVINEPKRGVGKKKIEFLEEYQNIHGCTLYQALLETSATKEFVKTKASELIDLIECIRNMKSRSVLDILDLILSKTGYEKELTNLGNDDRLDNLMALRAAVKEFDDRHDEGEGLPEYLQDIALYTNADNRQKNGVKMMTIHASKGLEFKCVFVIDLNEGIFPSGKVLDEEQMEEERRLMYVAMTRAEERLFLTDAGGYTFSGTYRYPSRFLFNIDNGIVDISSQMDKEIIEEAKAYIESLRRRRDTWV